MESFAGQFVVANPRLPDDNFYKTVVMMISHDEEGALGVVLNRPTTTSVSELWQEAFDETISTDSFAYWGGPVAGPPIALHQNPLVAERYVLNDLYVAVNQEQIKRLFDSGDKDVQLFLGYSGWGAGQLEYEIEAGGWFVGDACASDIFDDVTDLWKKAAGDIGNKIMFQDATPAHIPNDPSNN